MIKLQKQKYMHIPDEGQFGDCHRTAIAMVLGLDRDQVPHFLHDNCGNAEFRARVRDYLSTQGVAEVGVPIGGEGISPEHVMDCIACWSPDTPVILGGLSRTGINHSVVVFGGQMFDPSLTESGIVGPCNDGFYWCSMLVNLPSKARSAPP